MPSVRALRVGVAGVLAVWALVAAAAGVTACAPRAQSPGAARGLAPVRPNSATMPSSQVDFRNAETTVLAYVGAVRSGDATEAAQRMTRYRRAETRERGWKRSNAWWKAVRVTSISRPGHYLTDEPTFARLYTRHFGHPPFKLIVINVAYSAVASAPAGDIDFVVTKDKSDTPWLVHDFGGAVFAH